MKFVALLMALALTAPAVASECAALFDTERRKLHSAEQVDLCALTAGKAVLVVNTASHCGFTPQFKQLEALYQQYRGQGFEIIGFPSDDFFQESDQEQETANICYINYGVTFTMLAPGAVRGADADPLFAQITAQADRTPKWNFFKYLIGKDGKVIDAWASTTEPTDAAISMAIERALIVKR